MRRFLADTIAMVAFSTVVGMAIEVFVSGMPLWQSVQTRLVAMPVNILTARPYGKFRNWVFQKAGAPEAGWIRKALCDTVSFVLFQMPLYAGILLASGATLRQAATACGTASILTAAMGRPYGLCLELSRWLFGVSDQP